MFSKSITSEKLILRPYEYADTISWQRWDIDPDVQKFMPEQKKFSLHDQEEYLKACESEKDAYYWSIVWKSTNTLIGTIALTEIDMDQGIAELGIVVGEKEFWGRGVAHEALSEVIKLASTIGLQKVIAEFHEGNDAVEKLLIRNDFKKESVLNESRVKNGQLINAVRYIRSL